MTPIKNKYNTMNDVPIGTKMIIKKDRREGKLKEIIAFPTTFKIEFKDEKIDYFLTHQVEIIGWPPSE